MEIWPRAGLNSWLLYFYWSDLVVPTVYPLIALVDTLSTNGIEKNVESTRASTSRIADQHHKIVLKGEGLTQAVVKEPAEFLIDCSALTEPLQTSQIAVTLTGDKADIPVRINPLGARPQIYRATYTPLIAGKYNLKLFINDEALYGANRTVLLFYLLLLKF